MPLDSTGGVRVEDALTADERHRLQLLHPAVGDDELRAGLVRVLGAVAHLAGVRHDLLAVRRLHRVHDVVEVGALGQPALGVAVGEVAHEPGVLLHQRPDGSDAELVVERHAHELDGAELQEVLLLGEHQLQEVLVHVVVRREVELQLDTGGVEDGREDGTYLLLEVLDEVGLGVELAFQLVRLAPLAAGAAGVDEVGVLLHAETCND